MTVRYVSCCNHPLRIYLAGDVLSNGKLLFASLNTHTTVNIMHTVLTICHSRDLWKLARFCKELRLLCSPDTWNLPGTVLLGGFQSSCESFEIRWTRQCLLNVVLFGIMEQWNCEHLKWPLKVTCMSHSVNIFLIFDIYNIYIIEFLVV